MDQYPNYSNQYFQQPFNYPQFGYQPMQADRLSQLQRFQQSLQPTQMPPSNQLATLGKIVDSVDVVKATDVPMDGNMYYFPKADGTEIYAKQWLPNGQTRILVFKPVEYNEANHSSQNEEKSKTSGIEEFTEVLESKLNELYKKITDTKKKKEVNTDE